METWRPNRRLCLLCLLPLLLPSCAMPTRSPLADADFRVRGKVGVRDGDKGFSATFDWRQTGERYDIALRGPLGQGAVRLLGDGRAIAVTTAKGVVLQGENPDAVLANALGWSLPVAALRYWVRGRYDPAAQATQRTYGADGNLAAFRQHGWTVRLSRWQTLVGGTAPGKIVADRSDVRVALVCRQWRFD